MQARVGVPQSHETHTPSSQSPRPRQSASIAQRRPMSGTSGPPSNELSDSIVDASVIPGASGAPGRETRPPSANSQVQSSTSVEPIGHTQLPPTRISSPHGFAGILLLHATSPQINKAPISALFSIVPSPQTTATCGHRTRTSVRRSWQLARRCSEYSWATVSKDLYVYASQVIRCAPMYGQREFIPAGRLPTLEVD